MKISPQPVLKRLLRTFTDTRKQREIMMAFVNPLFADFGTVVSVIFLIIAFVGWLMNLISEKNQPAPPPRRHPPRPAQPGQIPRDQRLQSEIDVFLQEVQGQKPKADQAREERMRREQQRAEEERRKKQLKERQKSQRTGQHSGGKHQKKPSRIEESVRSHMEHADHMGEGVTKRSSESQPRQTRQERAAERAQEYLDAKAASKLDGPEAQNTLSGVMELLSDPKTIQQAILINEILSRPKTRL